MSDHMSHRQGHVSSSSSYSLEEREAPDPEASDRIHAHAVYWSVASCVVHAGLNMGSVPGETP